MLHTDLFEAAGDDLGYDLQKKYDEFNRLYFGGVLPKIPMSFANLKTVGGKVAVKVTPGPGGPPDPRRVRYGMAKRYDGYVAVPGSMRMVISSLYLRSHDSIDAILLHEMAHVYFQAVVQDFNEDHGPNFKKKIAELSRMSGIKVPLVDDAVGLELTAEKKKVAIGVLLINHDGRKSFGVASAKAAHANLAEEEKKWARRAIKNMTVTYYLIASEEWSKIAANLPLARGEIKNMYRFGKDDNVEQLLADLTEHGDVLFQVQN